MDESLEGKNWRFNFRNRKKLPDVKILQRQFRLGVACLGVGIVLTIVYLVGFIRSMSVSEQLDTLENAVNALQSENQKVIKDNLVFKQHAYILESVKNIYVPSLNAVDFLMMVGVTAPSELIFNSISLKEEQVVSANEFYRLYEAVLEGFIQSAEDDALKTINHFRSELVNIEYFKSIMSDFYVESVRRNMNDKDGKISFVIKIKLKTL